MLAFIGFGGLAFVAATLLATGVAHLAGLRGFARLLRQHGLLPAAVAAPVGVLVTGTEVTIGLGALVALSSGDPRLGTAAFAAALGIGGMFVAYLRQLLRAGHTGSCGCSPMAGPLTPASFAPAISLVAVGAVGLVASWASTTALLPPTAWSSLAVAWGLTLTALVLLLPATAPGRVAEAAS